MEEMTSEEIDQMFMRSASIHEAGHSVVARVTGIKVNRIELRRHNGGPEEVTIAGRIYYDYGPRFTSPDYEHAFPFVSLAGYVAEKFDAEQGDVSVDDLFDEVHFGLDSMSDTDRRGAGQITYTKLWRTLYLVRKHWAEIELQAAIARDDFEARQMPRLAA